MQLLKTKCIIEKEIQPECWDGDFSPSFLSCHSLTEKVILSIFLVFACFLVTAFLPAALGIQVSDIRGNISEGRAPKYRVSFLNLFKE